jgi:hypothetical protein
MSLDQSPVTLARLGTVTIDGQTGRVSVEGFEADGKATCRDVAALAALWAIGELQRQVLLTVEAPGRSRIVIE